MVVARRPVSDVLSRLEDMENRFLTTQFLAPVLQGHRVHVRIAGVICGIQVQPPSFEGWGVFRPLSHSTAQLTREATLLERKRYLNLLPMLRMILCRRTKKGWFALPVDSRSRVTVEGLPPIQLVESAELFQTIRVRFDGSAFWFDSLDTRQDPTLPGWLNECMKRSVPPVTLKRSGLTARQRHAYAIEFERRERVVAADRQDQIETQLRQALRHSGAALEKFVEHADGYRVTWAAAGQRHVTSVNRDDLTVQVAGICLSGKDGKFDLGSLVGVVREAEQNDEILTVGSESDGISEDDYWRIHPPE